MGERQEILNSAMAEPEIVEVSGIKLRKVSLMSLSMLSRIGSPFADLGRILKGEDIPAKYSDICEYIYIHVAPLEDVKRSIYFAPRAEFSMAADSFCASLKPEVFNEIMGVIFKESTEVEYARAEARKENGAPPSKNEQSPAESRV